MKEEICSLFDLRDPLIAENGWKKWFAAAKESNIPALVRFAKLKEKRIDGLIAHNRYKWNKATLTHILTRQEYCGDVVNFKTTKHFRDKRNHYVDRSQWHITENVHGLIPFFTGSIFLEHPEEEVNIERCPDALLQGSFQQR